MSAFFSVHKKILDLLCLIIPLSNIDINTKIVLKLLLQLHFLETNSRHKQSLSDIDIHVAMELQIDILTMKSFWLNRCWASQSILVSQQQRVKRDSSCYRLLEMYLEPFVRMKGFVLLMSKKISKDFRVISKTSQFNKIYLPVY